MQLNLQRELIGPDGNFTLKVELSIEKGELITLYGPSGSGKSTLLRIVAGLTTADRGWIKLDNTYWFNADKKIFTTTQQRSIGMVFQDYSLFPNMTVRENLSFALDKNQPKEIIDELLEITELKNLSNKRPSILSGGQKQRIALARALVRRPTLLLLDEPLSALNNDIRSKLQDYILLFHKRFNLTTILVSHDLPEVLKMSDRTIMIENGLIKKDGPPSDLFSTQMIVRA